MLDDQYPTVKRGPPKPSVIIEPNVFSMPRGTERYVVEGGGAVFIPLETGDQDRPQGQDRRRRLG